MLIKSSVISAENTEQLAISDENNIRDHHGLGWGASDSAMPQFTQRWQHRVIEKGLAASTPVASLTSSPSCDDSTSVFQEFTDCFQSCWTTQSHWEPVRGADDFTHSAAVRQTVVFTFSQINEEHKEWGRDGERKGEIAQWEAKQRDTSGRAETERWRSSDKLRWATLVLVARCQRPCVSSLGDFGPPWGHDSCTPSRTVSQLSSLYGSAGREQTTAWVSG